MPVNWKRAHTQVRPYEVRPMVQLMRNHIRGIVLVGADLCVRPDVHALTSSVREYTGIRVGPRQLFVLIK
jgi:hypothetical protein